MFYEFKVLKKKLLKKRKFPNYISKIKFLFLDYNSRKESRLEKIKKLTLRSSSQSFCCSGEISWHILKTLKIEIT